MRNMLKTNPQGRNAGCRAEGGGHLRPKNTPKDPKNNDPARIPSCRLPAPHDTTRVRVPAVVPYLSTTYNDLPECREVSIYIIKIDIKSEGIIRTGWVGVIILCNIRNIIIETFPAYLQILYFSPLYLLYR